MRKSNLFKSGIVFAVMAILMMAAALTVYAESDGSDNGNEHEHEYGYEHGYEHRHNTAENDNNNDNNDNNNDNGEEQPIIPTLGSLIIINSTHDGNLLEGAVFAVYLVGEDTRIAELETDETGRTIEIPLPQGNYNIVIISPADGHAPIVDVISTTITAGHKQEITIFSLPIHSPDPTPTPSPSPAAETGRLLITLRAQGTGQLLGGAVYELRRAMDNEFVAFLITDSFGEAALDLPVGDYFLREVLSVHGFIPNNDRVNVRIAANRLNELNLTSRPEPAPTPEPTPPPTQQQTPPEPGRLIVTVRVDGTREPLQGVMLEVRRAMDNRLVAELTTDRFGEAFVTLPPGDYFLRQLSAPQGFEFDTERTNVRIAAGAIREVSVTNRPVEPATPQMPPEQETPQPETVYGRLLVTVTSSETRDRLSGVFYTIHDVMTDEVIATISTNEFGEASVLLPPGQYFKRNSLMPPSYQVNPDRVNFTIRAGAITSMNATARAIPQQAAAQAPPTQAVPPTVQQTPPTQAQNQAPTTTTPDRPAQAQTQTQSRVEIITRAEKSGNPLHGAVFTVYRAADSQRVGEITTDTHGRASISLSAGEYYLRNNSVQFGFLRERSRIFFTVGTRGDVTVEVTIQRDGSIPYADGNITVPQTGELTPVMNYVLGTLFIGLALVCGLFLFGSRNKQHQKQKHKQKHKHHYKDSQFKRKGVKAYA